MTTRKTPQAGPFRIQMGAKVKDKLTGFTGVVTGRHEWMNGSPSYSVQSTKLTKDGSIPDTEGISEARLQRVR